jgi:hypothetical protein
MCPMPIRKNPALRQTLAARLREERSRHFATATGAARALRLETTGYTHHENGRRGISVEKAALFGKAFRVNPAYFLVLSASRDLEGSVPQATVSVPTIGEAAVGVWRESVDNMSRHLENLRVPEEVEWRSGGDEYALQLRDDSLNLFALPEEYLICEPIRSGPLDTSQFQVGDFLHVERTKRGNLTETSFRRVASINGAQLTLGTYSSNKRFRGSIKFPVPQGGHETVVIKGVVVAKHMHVRRRGQATR